MKFRRSNNLICSWDRDALRIENYKTGKLAIIEPVIVGIVAAVNDFISLEALEERFPNFPGLSAVVNQLIDFNILIPEGSSEEVDEELLSQWDWGMAAKIFLFATNYVDFETKNESVWQNLTHKAKTKAQPPSPFKKIAGITYVDLPKAGALPTKDINEVLKNRRTCRAFTTDSISIETLSLILFYCWGMTGQYTGGDLGNVIFKCSPSGGSRHPIEAYFIANNIEGLACGIYHYRVETHSVGLVKEGQFSNTCVDVCSGQEWVRKAPVLFVMTALLKRTMWKYEHSHAFRVINLDAGYLGQTFHLVCQSLGLGPFTSAASNNRLLERLLNLNPIEQPVICLCATGYPNPLIETDA